MEILTPDYCRECCRRIADLHEYIRRDADRQLAKELANIEKIVDGILRDSAIACCDLAIGPGVVVVGRERAYTLRARVDDPRREYLHDTSTPIIVAKHLAVIDNISRNLSLSREHEYLKQNNHIDGIGSCSEMVAACAAAIAEIEREIATERAKLMRMTAQGAACQWANVRIKIAALQSEIEILRGYHDAYSRGTTPYSPIAKSMFVPVKRTQVHTGDKLGSVRAHKGGLLTTRDGLQIETQKLYGIAELPGDVEPYTRGSRFSTTSPSSPRGSVEFGMSGRSSVESAKK